MLLVTCVSRTTRRHPRESFHPAYSCLNTPVCILAQKHFPEEAYTFLTRFCFNADLTSGVLGILHSLDLYSV